MTRSLLVMAAIVITVMWVFAVLGHTPVEAAQAGAPTFSPVPVPRPTLACDTRDSVVAKLGEKYGEVRRGAGLAGPFGAVVIYEVWASEATGSWTILKTTPNGLTCIMAVGDGWQDKSLTELRGNWL